MLINAELYEHHESNNNNQLDNELVSLYYRFKKHELLRNLNLMKRNHGNILEKRSDLFSDLSDRDLLLGTMW